jgi:diguanylate cyclase (GGDEF)-like protein
MTERRGRASTAEAVGGGDLCARVAPRAPGGEALFRLLDELLLADEDLVTISRTLTHRLHGLACCHSVRILRLDHDCQVAEVVGSFPAPRAWDSGGRLIPLEQFAGVIAALRSKPVLVIENLEAAGVPDQLLASLREEGARSSLLVGLFHDGWLEGVLCLAWDEEDEAEPHISLAQACARRLAMAVRCERLQQRCEFLRLELLSHASESGHELHRARRLALELGRIAGALDASAGVAAILAGLGEQLRGLGLGVILALRVPAGALRVSCHAFRPAVGAVVERVLGLPLVGLRVPARAWSGEQDGELPRAWRGAVTTNMVSELLPTVERSVLEELLSVVGLAPGTPFLVVPIQGPRGEIGFLVAWGVSFLEHVARELAVFGTQLGAVLDASRWGARERRKRVRLEALRNALVEVALHYELPRAMDDILMAAVDLLGAEHGLLALTADSGLELEVASVYGFASPEPGEMVNAAEDVVGEVLRSRIPIALRDHQLWPGRADAQGPSPWHAVLAVPLQARGWLTGVLLLARSSDYHPFSRSDTGLLEAFGQHAALAVENASLVSRLKEMMSTDALTGLANRRALFEQGALEIARAERFEQPLSVLMLDLDRFKRLNDDHGHATGDAALRAVGEAISRTCRNIDLCGRYGGEEFALILPGTALDGARLLAERVRRAIGDGTLAADDVPVRVTASVGVTQARSGEELAAVLARADEALAVAKRSGRDRVVVAGGPIE